MGHSLPASNTRGRGEQKRIWKGVCWGWLWPSVSFPGLSVVCVCRENTANGHKFSQQGRGLSSMSKWACMVIKDLGEDGNYLETFFCLFVLREMREKADKDSAQLDMKAKTVEFTISRIGWFPLPQNFSIWVERAVTAMIWGFGLCWADTFELTWIRDICETIVQMKSH